MFLRSAPEDLPVKKNVACCELNYDSPLNVMSIVNTYILPRQERMRVEAAARGRLRGLMFSAPEGVIK